MAETVNLAGPSSGLPEISTVAFNAAVNDALAQKADVADVQAAAATVDATLTQKANVADLAVISTTIQSVQDIAVATQQQVATTGLSLDFLAQAVTVLQSRSTTVENRFTVLETATPPPAVPNVVASFTLGATTNTTQVENWTAPASGPAPTEYRTYWALAGTGVWTPGPVIAAPGLTGTITGRTQGTLYDYRVIAANAAGPGAASATLTQRTTATFTPSPAWTEITNNTGTITMADGGQVAIVNGVMKLTPLGGAIGNMGTTGSVILALVSDLGRIFHESNDPSLANNPGGVGWFSWIGTPPNWVWSADPRAVTPPTGLRNPNTIPFASDSVWNIGIGKTTATWASAGAAETISLRSLGLAINGNNYGQPVYFGKASDPEILFTCTGDGIDGIGPFSQLMHCPVTAVPALPTDGDRHMTVFDATRPLIAVTLLFATFPTGSILGGVQGYLGSILDLTKAGLRPFTDFVGSRNWLGGVITPFDIGAGVIRHMVRMSLSQNSLLSPNPTPGDMTGSLWPNYYVDYDHAPAQYSGIIPAGTFGIPGSVNLATLGLSTGGMMLAKCLQDYGGVYRDSGGTSQFTFYTTPEMDNHPLIVQARLDGNKIRAVMARMTNQAQWGAITPPGSGHLNRTPPLIADYNGGATGRVAALPPVGVT